MIWSFGEQSVFTHCPCLSCLFLPVRFDPCVSGGVSDRPASPTSGWTTQLQRPRWSPPTCRLQTLSGTHYPQKIYQPIQHQLLRTWQPIPSTSPSAAASSAPWLPAWKAAEATLLRTPQAMYVREPNIPHTSRSDHCVYVEEEKWRADGP